MHQKDASIIQRSNVQSDVVVVNQCDENRIERFTFRNKFGRECSAIFVCTTERGLSKSRNMAISYAADDAICQLCDDDEILCDDTEEIVLNGYKQDPQASLIAFALTRKDNGKIYPAERRTLGFFQILKSSSQQLTFYKSELLRAGITFDEKMGSGTGNGGGEEIKLLLDMRRAGLKMMYNPNIIGTVMPGASQWFQGFTEDYLITFGWASQRTFGRVLGLVYSGAWALTHRKLLPFSYFKAVSLMAKGCFQNR
jgi:hypothetical protein